MVSYLLIMFGLILITVGAAYSFTSDFKDYVLTAINGYSGTPLENSMDSESIQTGNLLQAIFKYFLIIALPIVMFWVWTLAQKPQKGW